MTKLPPPTTPPVRAPAPAAAPQSKAPSAPIGSAPLPKDVKPAAKTAASPAASLATKDQVDRSKPRPPDASAAQRFTDYVLPLSEQQVGKQRPQRTDELHTALVVGVTDVLKCLVEPEGIAWIRSRASHLQRSPSDGMFMQLLPSDFAPKFGAALGAAFDNAEAREALRQRFGADAVGIDAAAERVVGRLLLGAIALDQKPSLRQLAAEMVPGAAPKLPPLPMTTLATNLINVLEASLEYFIANAGRLIKGDSSADLDELSGQLSTLKQEKLAIAAEINASTGSIVGLQMAHAEEVEKARQKAESDKICSVIGAIFGCIAAIVTAVAVSVATFGAGSGALIAAVAGVVGETAAEGVAIACAVSAIVVAVLTVVTSMPKLLELGAMIARACGSTAAAEMLEQAASDMETWMNDNPWFGAIVSVVKLGAAVLMGIVLASSLSSASSEVAGDVVEEGAEIAEQGAEVGVEGAEVGEEVADETESVVDDLATLATALESGAALVDGIGKVLSSNAMKELAAIQSRMENLRAQLAEVELEIKQLIGKLTEKNRQQEEVKEDIGERQEQEQRCMEALNKAAESYSQILAAAALT
ncbi:MAG: hypothetical protein IT381_01380 [Deltaproteobacteria bacterium]|nr:hypothetical protein [Deltaproteobacteria bacterium]